MYYIPFLSFRRSEPSCRVQVHTTRVPSLIDRGSVPLNNSRTIFPVPCRAARVLEFFDFNFEFLPCSSYSFFRLLAFSSSSKDFLRLYGFFCQTLYDRIGRNDFCLCIKINARIFTTSVTVYERLSAKFSAIPVCFERRRDATEPRQPPDRHTRGRWTWMRLIIYICYFVLTFSCFYLRFF